MGRKSKKIILKPTLFIACEGTSSEYQYFESWAQTDEALNVFERVNVYPDEDEHRPKTTPYELFEIAKKELDDSSAHYYWIVIDKDKHPKIPKTYMEAEKCGIEIAFSSRSFEEWILLHFEKNDTQFNATECKNSAKEPINCGTKNTPLCNPTDCLTGHIRRQNFIPNYSKKKTFDLFSEIKDKTEIAMINSAWQRHKINASLNQQSLYSLNPYTDVDKLILKLRGKDNKIKWGLTNQSIDLNGWEIKAVISNKILTLNFSHSKPQAIILNQEFELSTFFTASKNHNNSSCVVSSKSYLSTANGSNNNLFYSGDIVEYVIQLKSQPYFLFTVDKKLTNIYIELI